MQVACQWGGIGMVRGVYLRTCSESTEVAEALHGAPSTVRRHLESSVASGAGSAWRCRN